MDSDNPLPRFKRAWEFYQEGRIVDSIQELKKMEGETPNDPSLIETLATLYLEKNEWKLFELYTKKSMQFGPKSKNKYGAFGIIDKPWPQPTPEQVDNFRKEVMKKYGEEYKDAHMQTLIEVYLSEGGAKKKTSL